MTGRWSLLATLTLLALLGTPARADHFEIHHLEGGTLGGKVMVHLHGDAGAPYFLIASPTPGPTRVQGFDLAVDLSWFALSTSIPGMSGTMPSSGEQHVHVPLAPLSAWDGRQIYLQAVRMDPSNPNRITRASNAAHFTLGDYLSTHPTDAHQFPTALSSAALISQHRVLVAGGGAGSWLNPIGSTSSELWDPRTESFESVPSMSQSRALHSMTALGSVQADEVLVAGGLSASQSPVSKAEIYQPFGSVFRTTGDLSTARYGHAAVQLADGRVLVIGGAGQNGSTLDARAQAALASTEIWDPTFDGFLAGPQLSEPRFGPTATLLASGKVLVTGGLTWRNGAAVFCDTAEVYDAGAGAFETPIPMNVARLGHQTTRLLDGTVLVSGGWTGSVASPTATAATEIFLFVSNTFTPASSMQQARAFFGSARLPSGGQVVAVGGGHGAITNPTALDTIELFSPSTGLWSTLPQTLSQSRHNAGVLEMGHGKVIVTGGLGPSGLPRTQGELFFGK